MILFDFDTQSRWKSRKFDINLILDNSQVIVNQHDIEFNSIHVATSEQTKKKYLIERARRFKNIGARDPHTIPRNLYQLGGKDKLAYIESHNSTNQLSLFGEIKTDNAMYVARNQRLRHDSIMTYRDFEQSDKAVVLVEFPHRFIDFSDFITKSNQYTFDVLIADLKVDAWYWQRYTEWGKRINETFASLSQG